MKIIIADDHTLVRAGLTQLIKSINDTYKVIEAGSSQEILKHAKSNIDLILLDLDMPGVGSVQGVNQICNAMPSTAVVVISGNAASHVIQGCMDAGAMGFIPKSAANEVTRSAIQLVLSGEQYVPYTFLNQSSDNRPQNITPRQEQIWKLLVTGLSNKHIARELGLTEGTVKQHVSALFKHLNIHSRMEAAQKAKEIWG